jgi:DNA-binding PucR family transcriptional regulator
MRSPRSAGASGSRPWSARWTRTASPRCWPCRPDRTPTARWPGSPRRSGPGSATRTSSGPAAQRSFLEADHVAGAAAGYSGGLPYVRLADLRLRGLLHLLRDDSRVHAFAERELGPLLVHDDAGGTQLLTALTAYLAAGGNKAEAAKQAHLARPTMYERLRQIEDVLGVDLEPAESRLSLHVALLALQAAAGQAR